MLAPGYLSFPKLLFEACEVETLQSYCLHEMFYSAFPFIMKKQSPSYWIAANMVIFSEGS